MTKQYTSLEHNVPVKEKSFPSSCYVRMRHDGNGKVERKAAAAAAAA
jgi:hypothetical protein